MRPPLSSVPSPLSPFTQPNMLKKHTLFEIRHLRESEDRVEFKKANQGLFSYNGSGKSKATDRRKCILGYVVAFCNEGGGELIFGVDDAYPHRIIGTQQSQDQLGQFLLRSGKRAATQYEVHPDYKLQQQMQEQALEIGMAALQNQDERGKDTTEIFTDNAL